MVCNLKNQEDLNEVSSVGVSLSRIVEVARLDLQINNLGQHWDKHILNYYRSLLNGNHWSKMSRSVYLLFLYWNARNCPGLKHAVMYISCWTSREGSSVFVWKLFFQSTRVSNPWTTHCKVITFMNAHRNVTAFTSRSKWQPCTFTSGLFTILYWRPFGTISKNVSFWGKLYDHQIINVKLKYCISILKGLNKTPPKALL